MDVRLTPWSGVESLWRS